MSRIPTSKRNSNSVINNENNNPINLIPTTNPTSSNTTRKISFIQPFSKSSNTRLLSSNPSKILSNSHLQNNNNNNNNNIISEIPILNTTTTRARRASPRLSSKRNQVEINVVHPTSDPERRSDPIQVESEHEEEDEQLILVGNNSIPTPPSSQSPPTASGSGTIKVSSSQLQLPSSSIPISTSASSKVPPIRRSRSNSTALRPETQSQPTTNKPRLSSTTSNRARSLSVTPSTITTPLSTSRQKSTTPNPSSTSKSSSTKTKKSKLKPRPSETLPFAPHPHPTLESPTSSSMSAQKSKKFQDDDPLLLRGGEEMRGWGEGNFRDREDRSRSRSLSVVGGRRKSGGGGGGKRRSSALPPTLSVEDHQEEEEEEEEAITNILLVDNNSRFKDEESELEETDDVDLKRQRLDSIPDWNEFDLAPLGSGGVTTSEQGEEDDGLRDFGGYDDFGGFESDDGFEYGDLSNATASGSGEKQQDSLTSISTSGDYLIPLRAISSSPPPTIQQAHSQSDLMQLSTPPRPTSTTTTSTSKHQQQPRPSSPFIRQSQLLHLTADDSIDSIIISSPDRIQMEFIPSSSGLTVDETGVVPMEIGVKLELIEEWSFSVEAGNRVDEIEEELEVETPVKDKVEETIEERMEVAVVEMESEEEIEEVEETVEEQLVFSQNSIVPQVLESAIDRTEPQISEEEEEIVLLVGPSPNKSHNRLIRRSLSPQVSSPPPVLSIQDSTPSTASRLRSLSPILATIIPTSPPRSLQSADVTMASPSPKRPIVSSSPFPPTPPSYQQYQQQQMSQQALETSPSMTIPFTFSLPSIVQQDIAMQSPSPKKSISRIIPASIEKMRDSGIVARGKEVLMERFKEIQAEKEKEVVQVEEKREEAEEAEVPISIPIIPALTLASAVITHSYPAFTISTTSDHRSTPISISTAHHSQNRPFQSRPKSLFTPLSTTSQHQQNSTVRASSSKKLKPTHPTLPVVEISSTDPKAAARATAILKVYHDYVEQGLKAPSRLLLEAGLKGVEEEHIEEEPEEEEEELKELLESAEVEVLRNVSGMYSVSRSGAARQGSVAKSHTSSRRNQAYEMGSPTPSGTTLGGSRNQSQHQRSLSVASSHLAVVDSSSSKAISSPATSSINNNRMMITIPDRQWTSIEWRKLERALVDEGRAAKKESRVLVLDDVIWEFLENEGAGEEDCVGEWDWEKLLVRIKALQSRRERESHKKPTKPRNILVPLPPSLDAELQVASVRDEVSASSNDDVEVLVQVDSEQEEEDEEQEQEQAIAEAQVHVKVEEENSDMSDQEIEVVAGEELENESEEEQEEDEGEQVEPLSNQRSAVEVQYDSVSESEEEDSMDDTFFQQIRNTLAPSKVSSHHEEEEEQAFVHPPLALATSRFAHLYDEPIEKPPLPEASRSGTPEPTGSGSNSTPSSARKLFSYLGSLVKRSPALSSPASSAYSSPEASETSIIYESNPVPLSFSHLIPQSSPAHPSPLRKIRRLPISSNNVASLPFQSSTTPILRRRSSGGNSGGSGGRVWDQVEKVEEAEQREEEELRNSGGKRRAQVELRREDRVYGASPSMIPSGTRALDRPFGLKPEPRRFF